MVKYDYLIVGAGLFGSTCAYELQKNGKRVLVIEKRDHVAGNIYTKRIKGINVHVYGAHIFHTSKKEIWDYVNRFVEFNNFVNAPIAIYKGELYNLPFNMNTFTKLWPDVLTPNDAKRHIDLEKNKYNIKTPTNLEEQAISLVGETIYNKLIKGYTAKQWGKDCKDLPSFIIKRLPVRYTFNNNYFNDKYQGIPIGGYTQIIKKMLCNVDVKLETDYLNDKQYYSQMANKVIYTGPIDEYFEYCFGPLEYRAVRFETTELEIDNYQGNAVVNYTDIDIPYTRIIEHKHFEPDVKTDVTIISKEYSSQWHVGEDAYYPINNSDNNMLYEKYQEKAKTEQNVIFGGRLGEYKYYDMDKTIESALTMVKTLLKND